MNTEDLKNDLHPDSELAQMIADNAKNLKLGTIDSPSFLKALMGVETSFGKNNIPRFEPAYGPGGLYFQRSKNLQSLYEIYGSDVSRSYGPWQIMYATASFYGYPKEQSPLDLWSGFISGPYVVNYLNDEFKKGATTIDKLASAYNGGSFNPATMVLTQQYIKKFISIYSQLAPK